VTCVLHVQHLLDPGHNFMARRAWWFVKIHNPEAKMLVYWALVGVVPKTRITFDCDSGYSLMFDGPWLTDTQTSTLRGLQDQDFEG
jgi:hypothetical protein